MKMLNKNDFDGNLIYGGKKFHDHSLRTSLIFGEPSESWKSKFFAEKEAPIWLIHREKFDVLFQCPLCSSSILEKVIETTWVSVTKCTNCDFGFQNPRLKPEFVPELYSDSYTMEEVYSSEVSLELDFKKFLYGGELAIQFGSSMDSALDVGCGTGLALAAYRELGFRSLIGIEPAPYDFDPGFQIFNSFSDELPKQITNVSLISLWDTLEHVWDFSKMMESVSTALQPRGLVLVCVPNLRSLATRLIREKSPTFQLDHLNYFTVESLSRLFESSGLELVHVETIISEIDNCRNYLEFKEPYMSKPLNESAFSWLTPRYIHENMLGSRILALARKV